MFQININTKSIIILYNHFTTTVSRTVAFVLKIKNHAQDTLLPGDIIQYCKRKKKQETKVHITQYRAYLIRQHSFHSYFSCCS